MKGFINRLVVALGCAALVVGTASVVRAQCPGGCGGGGCGGGGCGGGGVGGSPVGPTLPGCVGSCKHCPEGCCWYRSIVDPCYPERYNYMSRTLVNAAMAPQVHNGHVLDQTVWNYFFEPGSDRLTTAGLSHLAYVARRRPAPDPVVYLQTAQDVIYDPAQPDKLMANRLILNQKRAQAVQAFLTAQTGCAFAVAVHDPAEVGLAAIPVNITIQRMYFTRFVGGLLTGNGSSQSMGGGGAGGGAGGGVGGGGGGAGGGGGVGGAAGQGF